jgi:hypothetical protein
MKTPLETATLKACRSARRAAAACRPKAESEAAMVEPATGERLKWIGA